MSTNTKSRNESAEAKKARLAEAQAKFVERDSIGGGGLALRDAVTLSVNSNGYCVLDYSSTICGDDDFVGVYANASLPQSDNLGGNDGWEWCTHTGSFPFTTDVQGQEGYVAIYWSKDYRTGEYVRACYTPGLPNGNAGSSVTGTTV